jgi:hypothetical protein
MAVRRQFNLTGLVVDGRTRAGYRVACHKCGHKDELVNTKPTGLPPEIIKQKFEQRGWEIANSGDRDVCPTCIAAAKKPSTAIAAKMAEAMEAKSNVVKIDVAKPAAEAPATMTREDRRIIFGKLNEVYLDEVRGYDNGWTDKRLADDLGVPQAWVRDLREENFGPEGLSEAARLSLEAAKKLSADLGRIEGQLLHLDDMRARLAKDIEDLKDKLAPVARDVREIHKATVRA